MTNEYLTLPDRRLAYQRFIGDTQKPGVMFLSGFASDMTGNKATYLAERCRAAGHSYICFDYRGCGLSDGDFADGTIGGWFDDACMVFDHLTAGPQILVGSSMGGWLSFLLAMKRPERIKAMVGIAAAPDFTEDLVWASLSPAQKEQLQNEVRIYDDNAPPDHRVPMTLRLIEEGRQHLVMRRPMTVRCPVRLLQGMKDTEVPWELASRIVENIAHKDASVTFIKDGDHRLSRPQDLDLLWQTVAAFLET